MNIHKRPPRENTLSASHSFQSPLTSSLNAIATRRYDGLFSDHNIVLDTREYRLNNLPGSTHKADDIGINIGASFETATSLTSLRHA